MGVGEVMKPQKALFHGAEQQRMPVPSRMIITTLASVLAVLPPGSGVDRDGRSR